MMKSRTITAVAVSAAILVVPVLFASADLFHKKLPRNEEIVHALNRLTFGPRPGDIEQVKKLGLKKWIDLQLHPDNIAENPELIAKLKPLDSLTMQQAVLVEHYPSPQVIQAVAAGRSPMPIDPSDRLLYERLAHRYKSRLEKKGLDPSKLAGPDGAKLTDILTGDQIRIAEKGTAEERAALLKSLPNDKIEQLVYALPGGGRKLFADASPEIRRKILQTTAPQQVVARDLWEGKLYRAVYSNRQLAEELTDFWFNHFNIYMDKGADRYLTTAYERDAIRPNVLGKFSAMLKATAQSPAMLFYLDNWQSVSPNAVTGNRRGPAPNAPKRRRGLNENYARELLELHTLGVDGGYTQQDVIEVARCFTGWTIKEPYRGAGFEFNPRMHDPGEKTVLGVKIPAGGGVDDGLKVLDIVTHHPATAHHISFELAQRFVADNPPPALVDAMAQTFQRTGGDLREVMKTMLTSREFWSQGAYRAKVKSPLEMVASALRATGADMTVAFGIANKIGDMGEPLYRKVEPTGYSNAGAEWLNSAALLERMNFALALTKNKLPGVKVDQQTLDGTPDALARAFLYTTVSPQTRQAIAANNEPASVAGLILGSPEFQRR
jgi:uncharacterized protein (DUF1800 family)